MFVLVFGLSYTSEGAYMESKFHKKTKCIKLLLRLTALVNLHLLYVNNLNYMVEGLKTDNVLVKAG